MMFIAGFVIGGTLGVFTAALASANSRTDTYYRGWVAGRTGVIEMDRLMDLHIKEHLRQEIDDA